MFVTFFFLSSSFCCLFLLDDLCLCFYLLDWAGRLIGVNRRCMDDVVIIYLTDGFPHVSYFTDLSFYLTPQAGLGYDLNNMRIKLLKLFATHGVSQMEYLR